MKDGKRRIAVLGAGGFVGSRLIELGVESPHVEWVPVLRSARSFARLSRLGVSAVRADTGDVGSLAKAISGFDGLVNLTLGESHRMVTETKVFHAACCAARIPLLVHMSSAVVYDRVSAGEVDDSSPMVKGHWMLYARAKIESEDFLRNRSGRGALPRVVILRPGLIWGPRSPWSHLPARALDRGEVWLAHGGEGICNLIHVDNLARCVQQVVVSPSDASGPFSVGDPGVMTWGEFYSKVASGLGYPEDRIRTVPAGPLRLSKSTAVEWLKQRQSFYAATRWLIPRLAGATKTRLKTLLPALAGGGFEPPSPLDARSVQREPRFNREQWSLQSTERKLGMTGFLQAFGDPKLMGATEVMASTLEWMRFAGYGKAIE